MSSMPRSQRRILVVDDTQTMRSMIRALLISEGYGTVMDCVNGEDAWRLFLFPTTSPFDLIVSDWDMPKMDGLSLLKNLRSLTNGQEKTPFIMLTGTTTAEKVRLVVEARVNDYIAKPFQPAKLLEKVARFLPESG